jgi:hypothetical protein
MSRVKDRAQENKTKEIVMIPFRSFLACQGEELPSSSSILPDPSSCYRPGNSCYSRELTFPDYVYDVEPKKTAPAIFSHQVEVPVYSHEDTGPAPPEFYARFYGSPARQMYKIECLVQFQCEVRRVDDRTFVMQQESCVLQHMFDPLTMESIGMPVKVMIGSKNVTYDETSNTFLPLAERKPVFYPSGIASWHMYNSLHVVAGKDSEDITVQYDRAIEDIPICIQLCPNYLILCVAGAFLLLV